MSKRTRATFNPNLDLNQPSCLLIKITAFKMQPMRWMSVNRRWKNGFARLHAERDGKSPQATPMTPDQLKIRALEIKIRRIAEDKTILKKATALLMLDSLNTSH